MTRDQELQNRENHDPRRSSLQYGEEQYMCCPGKLDLLEFRDVLVFTVPTTHEDKGKLEDASVFVVADVVIIKMIAAAVVAQAVLVVAS